MKQPETEAQLADVIRDAKGPLNIRGGGTRPIGVPSAGDGLSTAKMSGITLYEPGALTLVAQAGTPLAEIEAALAAENQRLPFEPMDHRGLLGTQGVPTIGGVVAANVSGPRRIQAGACRDSLIGVRFVDGGGTVIKNGGRVMKNVTGYDLAKLMAGSYGTLGVLSEVSFKLLPATDTSAMVTITGQSPSQAVASMSKALGSPFEVSGAAYAPVGPTGDPMTALRIEGFDASVSYRCTQLSELLSKDGEVAVVTDVEAVKAVWAMIRDCQALQDASGDIWRISVKPSDAPALLEALGDVSYLLDWGGGLMWVAAPKGSDLRAVSPQIAGHRTLMRADDETKTALGVFHPEPLPVQKLSAGLRAKFDPRGLLNAGMMG